MKKDYVLDHDWGSYNSDKTVKKLMLRDIDDFFKFFDNEIKNLYIAEMINKYCFKFKNNDIVEFIVEIME